jgi:hypothetical protein
MARFEGGGGARDGEIVGGVAAVWSKGAGLRKKGKLTCGPGWSGVERERGERMLGRRKEKMGRTGRLHAREEKERPTARSASRPEEKEKKRGDGPEEEKAG